MKNSLVASVAAAAMGVSSLSLADTLNLNDQVVTATRSALSASQGIASVSVIERADIERFQATNAMDVLRRVPGVQFVNNGGAGKSTSLYMRGSNSNHILVLIDGVRIGSATSGDPALQNLPIEQIERIEVVRGPRSSLYGSEAIGGVIQIFTRKGSASGEAKPYFSATAGSRNHHAGTAGVSGGSENAWYNLGVSSLGTRGIDARPGAPTNKEPDNDGYRELSGSLSGGYRFANGLLIDGNVLENHSHNDYDSGSNANDDGILRVYGARARFTPLDPWLVTLQLGRSEDRKKHYSGSVPTSVYNTRRNSFSLQNDIQVAQGQVLTLGYDYLQDSIASHQVYNETRRRNDGFFAQYLGQNGRHEWQLGFRHDDNEEHGTHNTGNIGYGLALTETLGFRASYGTAFKAPTFNQLYHPVNGNPDVTEETSKSLEIGLDGDHDWGHWSASLFRNSIIDLIAYQNLGGGLRAYNIDKAVIKGLELEVGSQLAGWDLLGNLTLQDPANRSKRIQGDLLQRRAEQIFNLDVDRRFGKIAVGATLHVEGRRWENATNTQELSGYNTFDLRAEYLLSDSWRLQASITNLFDTDYETARTYQQPGRAGYLTVRYQSL